MAVRLVPTRITGGFVTTATLLGAALIGGLPGPSTGTAQAQWVDEPAASILVEGGSFAQEVIREDLSDGGEPGGQSFTVGDHDGFDVWGGTCGSCAGTGCDHCRRAALIDHCGHPRKACWIGRADALILWRNAPPDRPLLNNGLVAGPLLNANGMDSTAAAGPRFSVFRVNNCTGHALEATYLRAANFRSIRPLSAVSEPYELAPPGIFGNELLPFETGNANLGSRLQSFELNRHHCHGQFLRFLAGFRWIEWQEQFTLQGASAGGINDFYQTNCINDLYGGQIGVDANLLALSWIRFDGLVKAGVYYNNAVQASQFATTDPLNPGAASVRVGESPLSGAFAGEVGFTGVMPITRCLDFRFGYFGLWLSGIAQPTQQLSGQQLTPGQPAEGTINANGGVVLQGVSLGLEGRW
jgi:hypothetical protein